MMLVLLLNGQVDYEVNAQQYQLTAGKMLVLPIGVDYFFESESSGGFYHKIVLELTGFLLSALTTSFGLNDTLLLDYPQSFIEDCLNIADIISTQRADDLPRLMGSTYELLHQVSLLDPRMKGRQTLWAKILSRFEGCIENNIGNEQLAKDAGVSYATYNRLFREHTKSSPQQYRIRKRMELACELLKNSSLSIKEIAHRAGYCNQFYFANEFRRVFHIPPRLFRGK